VPVEIDRPIGQCVVSTSPLAELIRLHKTDSRELTLSRHALLRAVNTLDAILAIAPLFRQQSDHFGLAGNTSVDNGGC
jgi:hypothetical protein